MVDGPALLELREITKDYPGVRALDCVSVAFRAGEVHALVGENGAGKSTLIKAITGAIRPSSGTIALGGEAYGQLDPIQALRMGICAVYQEFNLVPYLSVAENVFYGREISKGVLCDFRTQIEQTRQILAQLGVGIDPTSRVKDLSVAYQQIVEIAKAVSRDVKVLLLDEPTAPLTSTEIDALFNIVRSLQERGVAIIYISHRLDEVFNLADRVTVLRDGQFIATLDAKATNRQELIKLMVGRELSDIFPARQASATDEVALDVTKLTTSYISNVSFCLKKGEILGFAGLVGAGRTETARALFGADPLLAGTIVLHGRPVQIASPGDAIARGIGLIPEDRKQHGLLLKLNVIENVSISSLKSFSRLGYIRRRRERTAASKLVENLDIRTPSLDQLVKNLSGGNQQKVVLAKWLATQCDVLIFDEPTRGIDVGAKSEIHKLIVSLADSGKSIIMITSEMPELLGLSDRIIVMHEGTIVGELNRRDASQERILDMASHPARV